LGGWEERVVQFGDDKSLRAISLRDAFPLLNKWSKGAKIQV
jgi:hypothetical protein